MVEVSVGKNKFFVEKKQLENIDIIRTSANSWHFILDQNSYSISLISFNEEEKKIVLKINNSEFETFIKTETDILLSKLGLDVSSVKKVNQLKSPMPGLVISIPVSEGQSVNKGEPLIILEAMKMENILKAPENVVIKKIHVSLKETLEKGQKLIDFE